MKAKFLFFVASMFFVSPVLSEPQLEKGKEIYNGKGACASCHGIEGKADGPAAVALNPKPENFHEGDYSLDTDGDGKKGTKADIENIILNGAAKYGGSMMMAARADLTAEERSALAKYVLSLKKK
jgi:mono/diheme cytochrome c family protein